VNKGSRLCSSDQMFTVVKSKSVVMKVSRPGILLALAQYCRPCCELQSSSCLTIQWSS
jgi:hypothetical protein